MPDLHQVSEELFDQKLEELLEHYRYDNPTPEIDEILTGVTRVTTEQLARLEISELYMFIVAVLHEGYERCENSIVAPQKAEIFQRVLDFLDVVYDCSPELYLYGVRSFASTYTWFKVVQSVLVRFKVVDSDSWKRLSIRSKELITI